MGRAPILGGAALACFAIHAGVHLARGSGGDVLWVCTLGAALVGMGAALGWPRVVAIGVSWLAFGNPLWILDLVAGGELMPTSLLTHGVAFGLGCFYLARRGFPAWTFVLAWLAVLPVLMLTRAFAPAGANVNLVQRVPAGWETRFPNHLAYLAILLALALLSFFVVERAALWWLHRKST